MTERELIESTMERFSWWKCIIPIWCAVDAVNSAANKAKEQAAAAAATAELEAYKNQCKYEYNKSILNIKKTLHV
jgi:hypothetical protein